MNVMLGSKLNGERSASAGETKEQHQQEKQKEEHRQQQPFALPSFFWHGPNR